MLNLEGRFNALMGYFEYGMVVLTRDADGARRLSEALRKTASLQSFQLSPMGD
jgi:hypothetical protein